MIRRVLPQPVISLLILGLWMILAPAFTLGQFLLGLALALALPWLTRRFWPDPPRFVSPGAAIRLTGVVLYDIVTANILVAKQVLSPPERLQPAFFEVPLDIGEPFVATLLGSIITLTPGTLTAEIDRERNVLQVHALHLEDAGAAIAQIKARYEAPLMKVFRC